MLADTYNFREFGPVEVFGGGDDPRNSFIVPVQFSSVQFKTLTLTWC